MQVNRTRTQVAKLLVLAGVLPLLVWAFSLGAPPGYTGAPDEPTCWTSGCHLTDDGTLFVNSSAITIAFPGARNYTPGVQQRLRLDVNDTNGFAYGFQLSVRDYQNRQAGTLQPVGPTVVTASGGYQYLMHSMVLTTRQYQFDWTPPLTDVGPVSFYVAAVVGNNDQGPGGDRTHEKRITIPSVNGGAPSIDDNGVVHGATFTPDQGFAPNTFGTIWGRDLVAFTQTWSELFVNGRAPTELGGARVLVNNKPAFIYSATTAEDRSADTDQINFIFPDDNTRALVNVQVETPVGLSNIRRITLTDLAPAFFLWNDHYITALHNDFSAYAGPEDLFGDVVLNPPLRPAVVGDVVRLYGTGFGPTDPFVPAGQIPTTFPETAESVRVYFGQAEATVLYRGLTEFAGLYQIIVVVPNVSAGEYEVRAEIGGRMTQLGAYFLVAE